MPGGILRSQPSPTPTTAKTDPIHQGGSSFGVVYVNGLGREAMNAETPMKFPRGSVIVREKLAKADDAQPQLLTVMIKRARGFNSKANDWEFLTIDGATTKVLERQKQGSCLGCHKSQKDRDFVYPPPVKVIFE